MEIYDNSKPALSFYGGNAGTKKAFYKSDGAKWFLKFPKITKNFENVDISYTTGVLSEYIGSQIYKSMGIPVHETELGIYNDILVTACKDFKLNNSFYEMKNVFNENLGKYEKSREDLIGNTESSYYIELKELIYVFEHNENLKNIKEIKERFWDMFILKISSDFRYLNSFFSKLLINHDENLLNLKSFKEKIIGEKNPWENKLNKSNSSNLER